jgi:hypothetical protein
MSTQRDTSGKPPHGGGELSGGNAHTGGNAVQSEHHTGGVFMGAQFITTGDSTTVEVVATAQTPPGGERSPTKRSSATPRPRVSSQEITLVVLRTVNRFRLIRALDIAAAVFPERDLKAALSAAHRATSRLCVAKGARRKTSNANQESESSSQLNKPKRARSSRAFLVKYRSDAGQTYYGLTKAGAQWLRENGDPDTVDCSAQASVSTVCSKTNPEHEMWANTVTLTCAARGIKAWNESELKGLLGWSPDKPKVFPITVKTNRRVHVAARDSQGDRHLSRVLTDVMKGLLPDVLASTTTGAVWIEVDKSVRGGDRRKDLEHVIRHIGRTLTGVDQHLVSNRLGRVVVLCKKGNHFAGITKYLTQQIEDNNGHMAYRLETRGDDFNGDKPRPMLVPVNGVPGCYGVYRYLPIKVLDQTYWNFTLLGHLNIQMLPTWLPKYSYRGTTRTDGWLPDNVLPWASEKGSWAPV